MTLIAHHIYLLAPGADVAKIRRFYVETLGLTEAAKPDSLAQVPVVWFHAGAVLFHIGYPAFGEVGGGHTALAADNLDALRARLIDGDYPIDDDVIPMGYPRFYAADPWGNGFEFLPAMLRE